mmetsp:Transcript_47963/g.138834  ORF Transcript_47963/g.138834 Transcript_47963/m.138834 type:complete len:286 (-) Transcript_47963:22-879(-)
MPQQLPTLVPLLRQRLELGALPLHPLDLGRHLVDLCLGLLAGLLPVHLLRELLVVLVALPPPTLPLQDLAQLHDLLALLLGLLPAALGLGLQDFRLQAAPPLLAGPGADVLHLVLEQGLPDLGHPPLAVRGGHLLVVPQQRHGLAGDVPEPLLLRLELCLGNLRQHLVAQALTASGGGPAWRFQLHGGCCRSPGRGARLRSRLLGIVCGGWLVGGRLGLAWLAVCWLAGIRAAIACSLAATAVGIGLCILRLRNYFIGVGSDLDHACRGTRITTHGAPQPGPEAA